MPQWTVTVGFQILDVQVSEQTILMKRMGTLGNESFVRFGHRGRTDGAGFVCDRDIRNDEGHGMDSCTAQECVRGDGVIGLGTLMGFVKVDLPL
jgi:hypothetical protein